MQEFDTASLCRPIAMQPQSATIEECDWRRV
jgi:hypothetical protein